MDDSKINISNTYPRLIMIFGLIICIFGFIVCGYGALKNPFTFFNIVAFFFMIPLIYMFDNYLHLANAQIDNEYIYLKGLFFTKKIELKNIVTITQKKQRLKRYNESMIVVNFNHGFWKRFYIIPNNTSFDKKVDSRIFVMLNDYISKAKINNR